jgi:hypothetical protein
LIALTNGNYLYGMMHEAHGLRTNGAFVVEGIFSKSAVDVNSDENLNGGARCLLPKTIFLPSHTVK